MPRRYLNINIGDYLRDTQGLNSTVSGGYLHLLMHYVAHGKLPADDETLALIARMDRQQWRRNKPKIARFFDSNWRQGRIEIDIAKQDRVSILRKAAGHQGGSATRFNRRARSKFYPDG
jgi:uncharacterized protein YdaU (DUF1376 family)